MILYLIAKYGLKSLKPIQTLVQPTGCCKEINSYLYMCGWYLYIWGWVSASFSQLWSISIIYIFRYPVYTNFYTFFLLRYCHQHHPGRCFSWCDRKKRQNSYRYIYDLYDMYTYIYIYLYKLQMWWIFKIWGKFHTFVEFYTFEGLTTTTKKMGIISAFIPMIRNIFRTSKEYDLE